MIALSAIANADEAGSIRFVERQGRFGSYVAICDDTLAEAFDRVRELRRRVAKCPKRKCRHTWGD